MNLVDSQVRSSDVTDRRILRDMLEVPLELFVPTELKPMAHMDEKIPLTKASPGSPARGLMAPRAFAKLVQLKAEAGEKNALRLWDPIYYAQAILYMAYAEAPRHYLTACTPGGRDMVGVRTDTDLGTARALRAKAERIITAAEPPAGVSTDPGWYECKWCPFHAICHGGQLPAVNHRTSVHATPELDGDGR
mgnify:CR=1 FL=1